MSTGPDAVKWRQPLDPDYPSERTYAFAQLDRVGVSALPFAGRIGGNQAFINLDLGADIVKRTPDAVQLSTWKGVIDCRGFKEPIIWKAAVIEACATCLLIFVAGLSSHAVGALSTNPLAIGYGIAITTWVSISLFVFAAAPASGGHLNPFISMATLFAGLSTLPRTVLYIAAQLIGGLVGGFLLKLGLGGDHYFPAGFVGGCSINPSLLPLGQAFVLEFMCYCICIFLAFGVGLDPRQGQVFGPAFSPILVGLVVALSSFGTGFVREGWTGASLNPARCFGLMAAKENLNYQWIHWVAAVSAAGLNGALYWAIPPNPKTKTS